MQHAIAPDKPFLMYFAPGNGHAPHHATKGWSHQIQRKVRRGIGPAAGDHTPEPEEARSSFGRYRVDTAAQGYSGMDTLSADERRSTPG